MASVVHSPVGGRPSSPGPETRGEWALAAKSRMAANFERVTRLMANNNLLVGGPSLVHPGVRSFGHQLPLALSVPRVPDTRSPEQPRPPPPEEKTVHILGYSLALIRNSGIWELPWGHHQEAANAGGSDEPVTFPPDDDRPQGQDGDEDHYVLQALDDNHGDATLDDRGPQGGRLQGLQSGVAAVRQVRHPEVCFLEEGFQRPPPPPLPPPQDGVQERHRHESVLADATEDSILTDETTTSPTSHNRGSAATMRRLRAGRGRIPAGHGGSLYRFFGKLKNLVAMGLLRVFWSPVFEIMVVTIGFGLLLYVADTVTDLLNGMYYFFKGDVWWAAVTWGLVLLPGFIRGCYEALRRPAVPVSGFPFPINPAGSSRSLFSHRNQGPSTNNSSGKGPVEHTLNFGLDVLPTFKLSLPNNLVVKMTAYPLYILVMSAWFPVLPIIQYTKILILQLKAVTSKRQPESADLDWDSLFIRYDRTLEEVRRAISLKAVEAFMESAPQFFLQLYITYRNRNQDDVSLTVVAMTFSLLSLLKTCYDLQEVDRLDHCISAPASPVTFFVTSALWFLSVLSFRSLSISVLCLYLSHYKDHRGVVAVPFLAIFFSNIVLRVIFEPSGAFLHGAMASIAPARFICTAKGAGNFNPSFIFANLPKVSSCGCGGRGDGVVNNADRESDSMVTISRASEKMTFRYLVAYTVVNSLVHLAGLAVVAGLDPPFDHQEVLIGKKLVKIAVLPLASVLLLVSLIFTGLHWKVSLEGLFRSRVKYPKYAKLQSRLDTFSASSSFKRANDRNLQSGSPSAIRPDFLAMSGFFSKDPRSAELICCFDCGLEVRNWRQRGIGNDLETINIMHAASLLRYQVEDPETYLLKKSSSSSGHRITNVDIIRQAYNMIYRVKPVCGILLDHKIHFTDLAVRKKSFLGDEHVFSELQYSIDEAADAGFVRTSTITAACYSCRITVDWSNYAMAMVRSPWALHAWYAPGLERCYHLMGRLKDLDVRHLTYPTKPGFCSGRSTVSTMALAEAGFFCTSYSRDRATVRCHVTGCFAHAHFYDHKGNPQDLNKKLTMKSDAVSLDGRAISEGKRAREIPGSAITGVDREVPLVDHLLMNPRCPFLMDLFCDIEYRRKTFPHDWTEANNLGRITPEAVAAMGFVYYPSNSPEEDFRRDWVKLRSFKPAVDKSPITKCPKCDRKVDWSLVSQNFENFDELFKEPGINHC